MKETTDVDEAIEAAIAKNCQKMTDEEKQQQREVLKKVFKGGMTPKEAMGFDDKFVEQCYDYGYRLFQSGAFNEASEVFRFLIMLNPADKRYGEALGACYFKMKDYPKALSSYYLWSANDGDNPLPYYHIAECYMKMDEKMLAFTAYMCCQNAMYEQKEYKSLRDRVELILEKLGTELDEAAGWKQTPEKS